MLHMMLQLPSSSSSLLLLLSLAWQRQIDVESWCNIDDNCINVIVMDGNDTDLNKIDEFSTYLLGLFQRLVVHLQQNMIPCMENSFISSSSHNTRINHQMCLTYYCKYTFSKSIIKTSVSIHESNYFSLSRCSFSLWCTFIALKASIFALLMNTSLLTWSYNSLCNSCDLFLIFKIFHNSIP